MTDTPNPQAPEITREAVIETIATVRDVEECDGKWLKALCRSWLELEKLWHQSKESIANSNAQWSRLASILGLEPTLGIGQIQTAAKAVIVHLSVLQARNAKLERVYEAAKDVARNLEAQPDPNSTQAQFLVRVSRDMLSAALSAVEEEE